MNAKLVRFETILEKIECFSSRCWLYLPSKEKWGLSSSAAVLESAEVPTELEDEPDAGIPQFAKDNKLMQVIPISELQDIVKNAKAQKNNIDIFGLFNAFVHYYDNDDYIIYS